MTSNVVIALTKGRILDAELDLLSSIGIVPEEDPRKSRKLVFGTNRSDLEIMILRGADVATYVEHGIADMGMSGKDVLLEHGGTGFYEPLDLGLGKCRIMVAGLKDEPPLPSRLKIATKFTNTAKRFYASRGVQVDIIKLYGAMELAPVTGLAHRIVDIVETGNTLKANGLVPMDLITEISTRLIVNESSYKTKFQAIKEIIDALESSVAVQ
ncbi:MAG: ATP phosphoribosyltransferase [Pseudomonadales bacterium]|nr:ATP phosphoribosyltransferase [Pseudomonadales bacterium]MBO6566828.1 ATP phosphoribosyltransferase [Pseudomonadales bacterium]MBO6594239.1 ATP phosphoribosyltransferase [Pseudomonadales bacterium]MBO6656298.1 ATP phosphoribosyltransferase [Pseudomonadales bacterium]MBO6700738.1 ATP phosphoribosyltransferase [Pseudomonadales bacterium]